MVPHPTLLAFPLHDSLTPRPHARPLARPLAPSPRWSLAFPLPRPLTLTHLLLVTPQALRILLASLEGQAARSHRYIVPLVSLSIDYYIRVFVRVYTSPSEVKRSARSVMPGPQTRFVCGGR